MTKSSALRVAPGSDGVSIWSSEIFGTEDASRVRDFLSRAFSVQEVRGVELLRAKSYGRIQYAAVNNPGQIWKKLSAALRSQTVSLTDQAGPRVAVESVYLDGPSKSPVRVSRIGNSLSTWRVRYQSDDRLLLWHPALRNRRDVVFRLEEELAAILGVRDFSASALTAGVSIRFDKDAVTAELLARELEKAWPRVLDGLDGPPSRTRLFTSVGLLGLSFTGQYLVPALRPAAVAGVAIYSAPNVINAAKQLVRGQVGLSALYSAGLAFTLASGQPFASSLFAVLMQFWPHLARRKIVRTQRRLFAAQRKRPAWARVAHATGIEVEVAADEVRKGDLIVVRSGETIPVDGVVKDGAAAVLDVALFGSDQIEDKTQGDRVAAGAFVREGRLTIRVERTGAQTTASYVASLLPHAPIEGMPSSLEAERIANRNAKPALALAAVSLGVTRIPRISQGLIRPDYATGPRLSAQLTTLHSLGRGLQQGVLFRNPAALERLVPADAIVLDDTAGLDRRRSEVASIQAIAGISEELVVSYALAAYQELHGERAAAIASFAAKQRVARATIESATRGVGVARYVDSRGNKIEIASARYLAESKISVPKGLQASPVRRDVVDDEPALRPVFVLRNGEVIGRVSFARTGPIAGLSVVEALKAQYPKARIVHVSRLPNADVESLAGTLGIEHFHPRLSAAAKLDVIRGLGGKTIWIGDGTDPHVREQLVASTVSVSVASLSRVHDDAADILLPHKGLGGLAELVELSRAHAKRLEQDYRVVYAVNSLGAAGALFARFGSLHSGLLSHLGTGFVYARQVRDLNRLAAGVEAKQLALVQLAAR